MPFNKAPNQWFDGYSATTGTMTFKTSNGTAPVSFPEITDTEANASTGDYRKVLFGLMETLFQKYNSKASADRPSRVTVGRSGQTQSDNTITYQYIVTVNVSPASLEVTEEPIV